MTHEDLIPVEEAQKLHDKLLRGIKDNVGRPTSLRALREKDDIIEALKAYRAVSSLTSDQMGIDLHSIRKDEYVPPAKEEFSPPSIPEIFLVKYTSLSEEKSPDSEEGSVARFVLTPSFSGLAARMYYADGELVKAIAWIAPEHPEMVMDISTFVSCMRSVPIHINGTPSDLYVDGILTIRDRDVGEYNRWRMATKKGSPLPSEIEVLREMLSSDVIIRDFLRELAFVAYRSSDFKPMAELNKLGIVTPNQLISRPGDSIADVERLWDSFGGSINEDSLPTMRVKPNGIFVSTRDSDIATDDPVSYISIDRTLRSGIVQEVEFRTQVAGEIQCVLNLCQNSYLTGFGISEVYLTSADVVEDQNLYIGKEINFYQTKRGLHLAEVSPETVRMDIVHSGKTPLSLPDACPCCKSKLQRSRGSPGLFCTKGNSCPSSFRANILYACSSQVLNIPELQRVLENQLVQSLVLNKIQSFSEFLSSVGDDDKIALSSDVQEKLSDVIYGLIQGVSDGNPKVLIQLLKCYPIRGANDRLYRMMYNRLKKLRSEGTSPQDLVNELVRLADPQFVKQALAIKSQQFAAELASDFSRELPDMKRTINFLMSDMI